MFTPAAEVGGRSTAGPRSKLGPRPDVPYAIVAGRDVAPEEVEGKSNRRQPITRIARLDRPHHRTKIRHPIGLRWGGGANTSPRFHRLIDRITKVLGRSSECGVAGGRRHGSPSGSGTHEHR